MGTSNHSRNAPLPGQLFFDLDVFGPGYPKEWYWPWHARTQAHTGLVETVAVGMDRAYWEAREIHWTEWYVDTEKKPSVLSRRRVRR